MEDGVTSWNQELAEFVLSEAKEVLDLLAVLLAKPDFQFPAILPGERNMEGTFEALRGPMKLLKHLEAETYYRNGKKSRALLSSLERLELSNLVRSGDGEFIHEIVGVVQSREVREQLMGFLKDADPEAKKVVAEALLELDSGDNPTLEMFRGTFASQLNYIAALLEPKADLRDLVELGKQEDEMWGYEQAEKLLAKIDLPRLIDTISSFNNQRQLAAANFERGVRLRDFFSDTTPISSADIENLSPQKLADAFAAQMQPFTGTMVFQAGEETALRRLFLLSLITLENLEAIPNDPFTGQPMSFDEATGEFYSVGYDGNKIRNAR